MLVLPYFEVLEHVESLLLPLGSLVMGCFSAGIIMVSILLQTVSSVLDKKVRAVPGR